MSGGLPLHRYFYRLGLATLLTGSLIAGPSTAATLTRTSAFAYDASSGLLLKEIIESDTPALCLVTEYTYDARGQFPTTSSNALAQSETKTYDTRFGTVLTLTGPNALTTTWTYDNFGRKTLETRADGTKTK